jgi:hypothetical protein
MMMEEPGAWISLSAALTAVVELALGLKALPAHAHRQTETADADWRERHQKLDQMLVELLAQPSRYGFSVDEVLVRLRQRQEVS